LTDERRHFRKKGRVLAKKCNWLRASHIFKESGRGVPTPQEDRTPFFQNDFLQGVWRRRYDGGLGPGAKPVLRDPEEQVLEKGRPRKFTKGRAGRG